MGPFSQSRMSGAEVSANFDDIKKLIKEKEYILYQRIGDIEEAFKQLQVQQREMNNTLLEIMADVKKERKKELQE